MASTAGQLLLVTGTGWPLVALALPAVPCSVRRRATGVSAAAAEAAAAASAPALSPEPSPHHHHHHHREGREALEVQPPPPPPPQWTPPVGRPGLYDASGRLVLKSLTLPELEAWCASEGEEYPANRALQLWRWMYADPPAGSWVRRLEDTVGRQNGFSARFIDKVGSRVSLDGGLHLSQVVRAADGTRKLVFTLTEGEAAGGSVETVLIPIVRQQGLRDRLTICVSSQVGCAMNCQFCYTGRMGLLGNLTPAQIVEQVVEARRFLAQEGERTQLTNLVFMGMGEPLHNTEAVLAAADIVSHYLGLHISHNKITISTVGLVPEMRSVVARSRVQMALSLHATTDEVRDWIVPVNRRYDLASLTSALEELFPKPPDTATQPRRQQHQQQQHPQHQQQEQQEQQEQQQHEQQQAQGEEAGGVSASASGCAEAVGSRRSAVTVVVVPEAAGSRGAVSEPEAEAAGRWLPPVGPTTSSQHRGAAAVHPHLPGANDGSSSCSSGSSGSSGHDSPGASTEVGGSSSRLAGAASSASPSASAVGPGPGAGPGTWAGPATRGGSASTSGGSSSSSGGGGGGGGGRSLLVEYTMLHGINDTLEDAERLASMLSRVHCKVNLIVFNPHAGTRFQPSTEQAVTDFRSALVQRGLVCTIRDSRGDDEMAACGQLGNVGLTFRPSPILEAPERFRRFLLPPPAAKATAAAVSGDATSGGVPLAAA
ncbi:hypothetical protein PLESTM_000486100 [Pleodorina starrii]|nr:hypothetical protein PLESTM_000486100 [Pleodorina starrii]